MPEVTNERAENPKARRSGVMTTEHGIIITEVHLPADLPLQAYLPSGTPLQASCLCGWPSPVLSSRPKAAAAGEQHTAEVSYGQPSPYTVADGDVSMLDSRAEVAR